MATPDNHLLVKKNVLITAYGLEENRWRPSVDVLFRTAAVAYNKHCIGVILTGLLNDGTAGMIAIQKTGGTTIVQDPEEAEYDEMPRSVMDVLKPDHIVGLDKMGTTIEEILETNDAEPIVSVLTEILMETSIAENITTSIDNVKQRGEQSIFACPDCGGGLWEISQKGYNYFRCEVGHSFTEEDLETQQVAQVTSSIWIAVRVMEERKKLMEKLLKKFALKNMTITAKSYERKVVELDTHIDMLKKFLYRANTENN